MGIFNYLGLRCKKRSWWSTEFKHFNEGKAVELDFDDSNPVDSSSMRKDGKRGLTAKFGFCSLSRL